MKHKTKQGKQKQRIEFFMLHIFFLIVFCLFACSQIRLIFLVVCYFLLSIHNDEKEVGMEKKRKIKKKVVCVFF